MIHYTCDICGKETDCEMGINYGKTTKHGELYLSKKGILSVKEPRNLVATIRVSVLSLAHPATHICEKCRKKASEDARVFWSVDQ